MLAAVPVFIGFGVPFWTEGTTGILLSALLILAGAAAIWFFENLTRRWLDADGWLNDLFKTQDGEVDRDG